MGAPRPGRGAALPRGARPPQPRARPHGAVAGAADRGRHRGRVRRRPGRRPHRPTAAGRGPHRVAGGTGHPGEHPLHAADQRARQGGLHNQQGGERRDQRRWVGEADGLGDDERGHGGARDAQRPEQCGAAAVAAAAPELDDEAAEPGQASAPPRGHARCLLRGRAAVKRAGQRRGVRPPPRPRPRRRGARPGRSSPRRAGRRASRSSLRDGATRGSRPPGPTTGGSRKPARPSAGRAR